MTLVGVLSHQIGDVVSLPWFVEKIEKCCETGLFEPADLIGDIAKQVRQCWLAMDGDEGIALILTQIGEDRKRTCLITHVVGRDIRRWAHVVGEIEAWAVEQGCKRLEFACPANGERLALRHGLRKTHIIVEKDLDGR